MTSSDPLVAVIVLWCPLCAHLTNWVLLGVMHTVLCHPATVDALQLSRLRMHHHPLQPQNDLVDDNETRQ